jgi:histidinol-phosphate aminotransferase
LKADFSFDVPALIAASAKARVVILGNPNNPTGTMLENEDIQILAENTPALVAIDEAYFEFSRQSAQSLIERYSNIVVLRTFSKALRASGLRIGYLLGNPAVVSELEKIRLPFSLAAFQQIAGEAILEQREWLDSSIRTTLAERERVFAELVRLPRINPVPSQANFILFSPGPFQASEVFNRLCQKGILIRLFEFPGGSGMLRVSIGTERENNLFLKGLKEILSAVS